MNLEDRNEAVQSIRTGLTMLIGAVEELQVSNGAMRETLREILPTFQQAYDKQYSAQRQDLIGLAAARTSKQTLFVDQIMLVFEEGFDKKN